MDLEQSYKNFLDYLDREGATSLCEQLRHENTFVVFLELIQTNKLKETEVEDYLKNENNFIVESFIKFTKEKKPILSTIIRYNLKLFQRLLYRKQISARDYNERIRAQSFQFQIDNYYQPKEEWARRRIDICLESISPMPGEFMLDVGCGVGTFAFHIAKAGAKSIGIDYSIDSIGVARHLAEKFNMSEIVKFIVSDATRLPFRDLSFDKVVICDFIEHINYRDKIMLIEEVYRVLKPSGLAVISTPNIFRERIGFIKRRLNLIFKRIPLIETRLHFGLISKFKLEKLLIQSEFKFRRYYFDESRPYLAKIPFLREFLSAHVLWKIYRLV